MCIVARCKRTGRPSRSCSGVISPRINRDSWGIVEPPLQVKVESAGSLNGQELEQLKLDVEQKIQRVLRFKADVSIFDEGSLQPNTGRQASSKF